MSLSKARLFFVGLTWLRPYLNLFWILDRGAINIKDHAPLALLANLIIYKVPSADRDRGNKIDDVISVISMGVEDLPPLLRPSKELPDNIASFKGKRVAVDVSCILYRGVKSAEAPALDLLLIVITSMLAVLFRANWVGWPVDRVVGESGPRRLRGACRHVTRFDNGSRSR